MCHLRLPSLFLLFLPVLFSCDKSLKVNADWKDVTVVYGILDQTKDTTFIKVTKAFLGEGDALMFSKISDSSNYPNKLEVLLDEFSVGVAKDTTFIKSISCDTVTIHNKQAGDSIFFFPDQLMYYTTAKLNENYIYKLNIKNKQTGKEITAQTGLLQDFDIQKPLFGEDSVAPNFFPGKLFEVKWNPSKNGKRYQVVIRFFYLEALRSNSDSLYMRSFDWTVFPDVKPIDISSTQPFDLFIPGDAFYSAVGSKIDTNYLVDHRVAYKINFIFTVAAPELNTYMEVTEPSLSLVQEKPAFTNIINGIGLFSARFMKSTGLLKINPDTKNELKENAHTSNLGF